MARPGKKAGELLVGLDEFASICGVTPETMRKHLRGAPDDADWMVERGRRGVGYKIKAAGAVEWWRNRSATDGDDDARRAMIAQWRLEALGDAGDDEGLGLTGKQRYEEFRAAEAELEYREKIGQLCLVAKVEDETANAVIELRRKLQAVGPLIRRRFKLDRKVADAIEAELGERLIAFVKAIGGDAGN